MGKTFDEAISIISDVAGFVPGFQWAPIAGNAIAGTDEASRGDLLSAALSAVAAGAPALTSGLGKAAGEATTNALAPAAAPGQDLIGDILDNPAIAKSAQSASDFAEAAGKAAQFGTSLGANAALGAGAQPLFSSLGLRDASAQAPASTQPGLTPAAKGGLAGAGGGAGPGLGAGGLDIQGGTAPKIYPYVQSNQGPPVGSSSQQASGAGTSGSGVQSGAQPGMQQQSRSI